MNAIETGSQTNYPCAGEPTLASAWRAAACVEITDELLEWPADVFALTDVALARSGAYRFAVSRQGKTRWPPDRHDWPHAVEEAGRQWGTWVEDRRRAMPAVLSEQWAVFRRGADTPLERLAEGTDWRMCEALLTLHAIADEACAGLGVALDSSSGHGC